jgi:serine/threonine-protein kinase RsbW
VIASDLGEARRIQDSVEKQLRKHHYDDKEIFGIRLALEEALVNAIKHGNRMDGSKKVQVRYRILQDRVEFAIADEGAGFNPDDLPNCLADENLQRPCGRGLFLMRHYMSEVVVHPPGNRLSMFKLRSTNGERHHV